MMKPLNSLTLAAALLGAACSAPTSAEEVFLGHPIESVTIPGAAIGPAPDGGRLLYVVANGNPAVFTAVEVPSGRQVHSQELPGVHGSWSLDVSPDGAVYIGTNRNGHLYRWAPGDTEARSVAGGRVLGETHIFGVAFGEDGLLYGGTFPGGIVFRHDPASGEFRDYGQAVDGVRYVRAVAHLDGVIYAGTFPEYHLVAVDAETGEKRKLSFPGDEPEWVGNLRAVNGLLLARIGDNLHAYDPSRDAWVAEGPPMERFSQTSWHAETETLHVVASGRVYAWNLRTFELNRLDSRVPFAPRALEVMDLQEPDFTGPTLVGAGVRGGIWLLHLESGRVESRDAEISGVPITIRSMERGPDGNIYIGGYLSPQEMARWLPEEERLEKIPFGAQIEAMLPHNGKLYLGRYPDASILAYDPAEPVSDDNPRLLFRLGDRGQDRPFGFASVGSGVAVGTVPKAGSLGGVLAFYNPRNDEVTVHEKVIPDQSIVSLVYRDGVLYGGTSIWGGIGIDPVAEEAVLFAWDVREERLLWSEAPLPGEQAVSNLMFDPQGRLWGITAGKVFQFDPRQRRVVRSLEIAPFGWDRTYWQSSFLSWDEATGRIVGLAAGSVFSLHPENWNTEIHATRAGFFANDARGNLYFGRGAELFQYRRR